LQWSVPGALLPLYSLHLKGLGFDEMSVAACCATQAAAAVVSSLVAGQAADRWIPAERALALCAAVAGMLLWLLPLLSATWAVFAVTLLFWMVCGPMTLLGTTVTFTHLASPQRQFGPVRMWGTVGWAGVGLLIGAWQWLGGVRADAFRIGGLIAFALAWYALTLPTTPPRERAAARFAPLRAMGLLRDQTFLVYFLCMFGASLTFPFNTQLLPMLLERLGVPPENISATLTLCQATEILTLLILPGILLTLGLRRTMLVGLTAWCLAFLATSLGSPGWLVVGSMLLHGLYLTGFIIAGQVYVNGVAEGDMRASVQGLFNCVSGAGLLLGNLLAGWLRAANGDDLPAAFRVAAGVNLCMLALFAVRFRYRPG
jgi:predicted MFS family arabinose efflux permease